MLQKMIGNSPLLSGLRSKYETLIHGLKEFMEKIKPGSTFFVVMSDPEIGIRPVRCCVLDTVVTFWGGSSPFENVTLYKLTDGHRGFLDDLLSYGGSACFTDIYEANMYRNDLLANWEDLIVPSNEAAVV